MIDKRDIVMAFLSIQCTYAGYMWLQAEKKAAYLAGQLHMVQWSVVDDNGEGVHKAVPRREKW